MEKVKMGILTAGRIAGTMAGTITQMDCVSAYAVAARDLDKAKQFADTYGIEKAYGSYEELLEDPLVELVYVASPHSHHYEHIKMCLEHGKHVLCEKAFTVNEQQAKEVLKLAEEKHLLLTEAMWVRYMPMAEKLKEVIRSGVIGEISTVSANLYYLIDHKDRITDPALAGGALLDVGVYALTFASIAMGDEVEQIRAVGILTPDGVDAQNQVTLIYKDGRMAVLSSGIMSISDRKGIIYGRKGYVIVENINNFESIQVYDTDRRLIASYPCPEQISGYEYEVEACVKAIHSGALECAQMPHEETRTVMRWMDEVRRQLGITYPCE